MLKALSDYLNVTFSALSFKMEYCIYCLPHYEYLMYVRGIGKYKGLYKCEGFLLKADAVCFPLGEWRGLSNSAVELRQSF